NNPPWIKSIAEHVAFPGSSDGHFKPGPRAMDRPPQRVTPSKGQPKRASAPCGWPSIDTLVLHRLTIRDATASHIVPARVDTLGAGMGWRPHERGSTPTNGPLANIRPPPTQAPPAPRRPRSGVPLRPSPRYSPG